MNKIKNFFGSRRWFRISNSNYIPLGKYPDYKFALRENESKYRQVLQTNAYLSTRWSLRDDIRRWLRYSCAFTIVALYFKLFITALLGFYLIARYIIFHVKVNREMRFVRDNYDTTLSEEDYEFWQDKI